MEKFLEYHVGRGPQGSSPLWDVFLELIKILSASMNEFM